MCGRFTLTKPPDTITQHFALPKSASAAARPRYNIAPSQTVLAVRVRPGQAARELAQPQWGLIPAWTRDLKTCPKPINARAETIASRPAFRDAFNVRRCLIPADGFYEWQPAGKRKQPWFIHRADDGLFAFGGLWDAWCDPATGELVETCAIITTAPNDLMAQVHDRMPLILDPADYDAWLSPRQPPPTELLRPYPPCEMRMHPVSPLVGSPSNDQPECREAISRGAVAPGG